MTSFPQAQFERSKVGSEWAQGGLNHGLDTRWHDEGRFRLRGRPIHVSEMIGQVLVKGEL